MRDLLYGLGEAIGCVLCAAIIWAGFVVVVAMALGFATRAFAWVSGLAL